jgi:glutamate formiminotransferase/formiminotetrahydrofolate cyclodeaminase
VAEKGNANAISDAGVAALLAQAACRGAAYNVRLNVQALDDKSKGAGLAREAEQLVKKAGELAERAVSAVERALSS